MISIYSTIQLGLVSKRPFPSKARVQDITVTERHAGHLTSRYDASALQVHV